MNRIKIIEIPERVVAALRFSGRWSNSVFKKKSEQLLEELDKAKIKTVGRYFFDEI